MKRWLRFSLRTMLLLITVLCIWLGFQVNAARRQREAVAAILDAGGTVYYDYQVISRGVGLPRYGFDLSRTPPGPEWLRKYIGGDYFCTAIVVDLHRPNIANGDLDQLGQQITKLTKLRILSLNGTGISDA